MNIKTYKSLGQSLRDLMPRQIDQPDALDRLERLGLAPTFANGVALSLVDRAVRDGNTTAFQAIRDTLGEKGERPVTDPEALDLTRCTDQELVRLLQEVEG